MSVVLKKDMIDKKILEENKIEYLFTNEINSHDIDIRIAIVNLMPRKEETELQFLKLISRYPKNIKIHFIRMKSHNPKNSDLTRLENYYKTLDDIRGTRYDGMIISGAPVEKVDYDNITYWEELKELFEYGRVSVKSNLFVCWACQASLYYYYNIKRRNLPSRIFGIYKYENLKDDPLVRGFDDRYYIPESRYTYIDDSDVSDKNLKIIGKSKSRGVNLMSTNDYKFIYSFGHWEYERFTLENEYIRNKDMGKDVKYPVNYYNSNELCKDIEVRWNSASNLFYFNWLNIIDKMND